MSLWACIEHGLTGPMACCGKASLASLTATDQFPQKAVGGSDVCHTCAAYVKVITEDLEPRIRELEAREATWNMRHERETAIADKACARARELEGALREIAVGLTEEDNVADYHNRYQMCASRLCKIARDALRSTAETAGETIFNKDITIIGSAAETKGDAT